MREPHCGLGVMAVDLETDEDDNADKHFEADLIVQMPEGVRSDLERVVDLEDLRVCLPSDLALDGTYGQSWLLVTGSHISVLT